MRARDLALWLEFEEVTKGRQAITFSAGLRELYGVKVLSEDEIVNEDSVESEVQAVRKLTVSEVKICTNMDAYLELVEAIEVGGVAAVEEALDNILVRYLKKHKMAAHWADRVTPECDEAL